MIPDDERRHLLSGPRPGERPGGAGTVNVKAEAPNAAVALERCRQVMLTVADNSSGSWPPLEDWRELLPDWFVAASVGEPPEETDRWLAWWRRLSPADQAAANEERTWSLPNWLFWIEPCERQWFWWDGTVKGPDIVEVEVEVPGWPAPLGALGWLLRASGARSVIYP